MLDAERHGVYSAPAMTMIARRIFFRRRREERPSSRRLRGVAGAAARARHRA